MRTHRGAGSWYIYIDCLDELSAINMASSPIKIPLDTEIDIKGSISTHTDVERATGHEEHSLFVRKTLLVLVIRRPLPITYLSSRRKVDWRLLPLLGTLYALALIDRTNLGVARIAGMDRDLVFSPFVAHFVLN